jgi:dTDP-4-dehydrorhamnose reductase
VRTEARRSLLVTGASGMLGQAVVAEAQRHGYDVTGLARDRLDVADARAVDEAVARIAPDTIVNCAAWTDVDGAEAHEAEATAINGAGAGNVARAGRAHGAFVVQVSTDYVFDGSKTTPWAESDPTGPRSAYGRSKLAGEESVAAATPEHAIVRTAWLFGTGGRNFVDTMLRLGAERDEVTVVTDQVGSPTWTGHLAGALLEIAQRRMAGIHHVAGSGRCSWNEFAIEIFDRAGVDCPVRPMTSDRLDRPAPRPAFSVLGVNRPDTPVLPPWQEGLAAYLAVRDRAVAGGTR